MFAQQSPSLSKSGPGTVESMGETLEPQDMSPREVLRPHWGCQDLFLGQGGFSLLQHLGRHHSAECEPIQALGRSLSKEQRGPGPPRQGIWLGLWLGLGLVLGLGLWLDLGLG